MEEICQFSADRKHRFTLWRSFPATFAFEPIKPGFVQFIGLNPSTADEKIDDPTIRRCKAFASRWGYRFLCMTNLFSYRETSPILMMQQPMPNLKENDEWLEMIAEESALVVCAWGCDGAFRQRSRAVISILSRVEKPLYCLGKTENGEPKHPLYLRRDVELVTL